jgi:hypothetical protein
MTRQQHWATRSYHEFLLNRAKAPFAWGTNDCALFAADGVKAITGVDIAADFRGKYTDEASALTAIRDICSGTTVADAAVYCASKAGLTELTHPLKAQRGDLVVCKNADGTPIAGLVHLNGRHVVTVSTKGLVRLSITSVLRAWHY